MVFAIFGISSLVFLMLPLCVQTADNKIRLLLDKNSATTGFLQVFQNGAWGFVCRNNFDMTDATVACKQLGYDAVTLSSWWTSSSPESFFLDNLHCVAEDLAIHDCRHDGWMIHNCQISENVQVYLGCLGGTRQIVYDLILNSKHYWSCDYFTSGVYYDFKNGKNAVVRGTAILDRSPINSGFRLKGKSSWVELEDFSNIPCLMDPSICELTVSFWIKISRKTGHKTFIFGNQYNNEYARGFTIYMQNHRLRGYVLGSDRYCRFMEYYFSTNLWFHFLMMWPPENDKIQVYKDGNYIGNRGCNCPSASNVDFIENGVYTMGVDETKAGNSNRDLDVSFDEVAIWYSKLSEDELKSFVKLAQDKGADVSINQLTLKLPDIPWDESYTDTSSISYINLSTAITNQLQEIYSSSGSGGGYNSFELQNLMDRDGVLQLSLRLSYSTIVWQHGFYLQRSFSQGNFLTSAVEILDCESYFEFCAGPHIKSITPRDDGWHVKISIDCNPEYFDTGLFQGYYIRAEEVNGSYTRGISVYPESSPTYSFFFKLIPKTKFSFYLVTRSYLGQGFLFGNTSYGYTLEQRPNVGPTNISVISTTHSNITIAWAAIPDSVAGVILKYSVFLMNSRDEKVGDIVVKPDERIAPFGGLFAFKRYHARICGFTANPKCGKVSISKWFYTLSIPPDKAPQNVLIDQIGPHSVYISWYAVEWSSQNGRMLYYDLRIKNLRTDTFEVFINHTISDQGVTNSYEWVNDLKGLTPYQVNISLVNNAGIGPAANATFITQESVPSEAPQNFTIQNKTAITITLGWSLLDVEDMNGILLGYRLFFKNINITKNWSLIDTDNTTVNITVTPVLVFFTYEFQLCGFTAVGEGVFTQTMTTIVPGKKPVNVASEATTLAVQNDSMVIQWRFITQVERPAYFFIITATRNDTNITEVQERMDTLFWPGEVYQYTIMGLKEFKWYNIRMAAGNNAGMGQFLFDPVRNRTLEGVPSASPRNLTAVNESSTSMVLQWRPVLYEYADGEILGYFVYWRLATSPGKSSAWESLQINGSVNTNVIINNLKKFKDYDFKISAFNSVAESVKTDPVVAKTDEDVPGHPPLNVICRNTSSRSLEVNWEPVPPQWHFGIIRGYELSIKDTNNGTMWIHKVSINETNFERRGLERYTNYTIQVAAFTNKGSGNFSKPIIVLTDEDVPSEAPGNILCSNTSSTSLSVRWTVLPVAKAHGIVRRYKVFLNRSDGRESTRINTPLWSLTNIAFSNLDEFVNYTVEILGITIKGEGVLSEPTKCLTDQDVPKDFPQDLRGYNTSDTSIKVFWKEVPKDHHNGIITGYSVFYNTTLRNGDILDNNTILGSDIMKYNITGLLPFKHYDIQVAAWTSKGLGYKSNIVTIRTEEEAPKIAPGDVKAFNTSSTSITLSWQAIPPENVGGILRGYKIFWEEIYYNGTVILQSETRLDNVSVTLLRFSGLTKYQEYRFSLLAFTKFDGVLSIPVATMTDEDIPTASPFKCSGFNISKNTIKVIWDVVPRSERNGIIISYNVYSDKTLNHATFMKSVPNTFPTTYVEHHNLTVINTALALNRSVVRHWLIPYTDYSFQVAAFTSKGEGPRCEHFVVRTEEEAPRYAPGNLTVHNTSSTSLLVTWAGVDASRIRGIFRGYRIWYTAEPQFPDAYVTYADQETRRKRRAAFTLTNQSTTTGVLYTTNELTGLAKYTNYSIHVMALSKFEGAQSLSVQMITDEDKPSKTPHNFHGYNLSSTSLQLKWNPVPDGFVHGILLGYRLYYRITKFLSMPLINITYDPSTLSDTLHDLLMFTAYTFQITAFTSKGEGPYTQPIIVTTDEDVASMSPLGFKVVTLIQTHEIPMTWHPVPNGFLNGILVGYRVKMREVSEGMEDIDGKEIHVDFGPETLNFTARNLPNFATYTFQVVALTKYGEGLHSPRKVAKTCPCEKNLTTNWFPLPPYTNKTEYEVTGIFPWLIDNMVTDCCRNCYNGHGWSKTFYNVDGKGAEGFKYKMLSFKNNIDDDTDFNFPVEGHGLQDKYASFYAYVFSIASPGVAFFIIDDPPGKMPNAILTTASSSWSLLLFAVIFSFMAGIIMWFMDAGANEIEFPKQFCKGAGEGFWWAFISMTTVGYGDRSPLSIQARLFAIIWILTGLVLTSILMGSITNALTTVTFASKSIKLYGTKVAAIVGSPAYRIGIRRNAKIDHGKEYNDAFELQADLTSRKVKGALLDGYMAGSYNQLFENEHIRVHEIIDYKTGYGIVLGGRSKRLQKCFKIYAKRKRSYIIDHVAKEIKTVKKNPKSAAESLCTDLFSPKADIFIMSMATCLGMLLVAFIVGLCLQVYFKRRLGNKVRDSTETYDKVTIKDLTELLESFRERMSSLKQELRNKHINELRVLLGLKRRPVKYVILQDLKQEEMSELESQCGIMTMLEINTLREDSLEILIGDDEDSEGSPPVELLSTSLNSLASLVSSSSSCAEVDTEHIVDRKPAIEELQREAYMAGLKPQGSDESGHPYAKMYRYLWVEKNI